MASNPLSGFKAHALSLAMTVSSWFRPKRYGYGLTPATWQGWALTFGLVVLMVVAARIFGS